MLIGKLDLNQTEKNITSSQIQVKSTSTEFYMHTYIRHTVEPDCAHVPIRNNVRPRSSTPGIQQMK